ncbi:MAG: sugar phosphate isomerase/epimerase [Bryobacterales bacterium]|nr:sugar phosphate isomerase/epimerase [Bryobacterales bacterium]
MSLNSSLSRRSFFAAAGAAALAPSVFGKKKIPVGIELYSVRTEMAKNIFEPVKAVAKMGYDGVEFYGPYMSWTIDQAKEMRKLMDDLKIKCYSTHNGSDSFTEAKISKAIELNNILGSKYIVMASAGRVTGADGWKKVAETLSSSAEKVKSAGLKVGFHNHATEWKPVDGQRPMDILAKGTPTHVMLQLDIGTTIEAGVDPVEWIKLNPGRINCIHCKDYSKEKGYKVLLGDGASPWKEIFKAAEKKGGIEFYLVEQEGYDLPPYEVAEKCLANFKKLHG